MAQESVLRIVIDSRNAERNARALANELDSIEKKGDFASKSMDQMSVATRQLAGYMAGLVTVGAAINKMDAYTNLQNRLKLVTNSQQELNQAMNDTFKIAQSSYQSWDSVVQVYQRFSDNAKTLGINMEQTAKLTETVSKAVAVSGASTQAAEAALTQFGQALASGTLRGEELNSILEQTPALAKAIAQGMEITVGQLRSVAAEGKITGEVLVDALTKSADSVDQLFQKTDVTIGQSIGLLSNELTKFIGEAGQSSGAASLLAGSVKLLAQNLSLIADVAVVAGIGYITKAILTKTVAVHSAIAASMAQKAADAAEAQSSIAVATTKVNEAKAHLANVQATNAETQAKYGAAAANARYKLASDAVTQALIAQNAAQGALNTSVTLGSRALALVGGPIGAITLGVSALAAGYMYLQNRTAEANAKLEEQGKIAQETDTELRKLSGNDKISAVRDLTAAFNDQNATLAKSKESVDAVLFAIRAAAVENEKARKVAEDARDGLISYNDAIRMLNEMEIRPDLYDMLKKQAKEYDVNSTKAGNSQKALKSLGIEVKLSGNSFQNAVNQIDKHSEALDKNKTAAQKAAEGLEAVKKSLFDREYKAYLTKALLAKGYSEDQVRVMIDTANFARKEGIQLTNEMYQAALKVAGIEEQNKKVIDSRNAAERERTKELEKQQKVLTASSKVQANAAKYNFAGLESKYGLPSGTLSAIHAIETGNTGKSNQVNKQTGATGGFQFLAGTAKQYGVKDRTDLAQSAEGAAKYMSYLLKLFKGDLEKAVRAYHAGEGNVQKGKNIGKYNNDYWQKFKGYTAGVNGFTAGDVGSKEWEKLLEEAAKMAEQQAELRKNLEQNVASEVTRIRSKLADDLQEIDKAGYSPERAKELKAEYQARADNDIAIAEYALKTKLDDYEAFKKTEDQLLKDSFDQRKFYAATDIELSKEQRDKAIQFLEEQYQHEKALMLLAKETRLFQVEQAMMSEMQIIQKRYALEYAEISRINDLEERSRRMNAATYSKKMDEDDLQWSTTLNYNNAIGVDTSAVQALKARQDAIDAMYQEGFIKQTEYEAQSLASRQQYDRDLQSSALSSLNTLLSATSSTWSNMTQMIKEKSGEQSGAYKTMFAMQQAFSVTSATINALLAYNQVLASPWTFDPISKQLAASITLGMGMANVGLIAGQTIAGFANGGYTGHGGKYEPAGVVHKGEGVLTQEEVKALGGPQGFEDLRKSIRRGYSAGGLVADTHRVGMGAVSAINSGGATVVQPKVVINNYSSEKVETSTNQDGELMVTIGKMVNSMVDQKVDQRFLKARRQGGELYGIK